MSAPSQPQPQSSGRPKNTFPLDLDKVSLEQALRDFEIANARVLDLTQRLIASERRRTEVENELQQLRLEQRTPAQAPSVAQEAVKWAVDVAGGLVRRLRK